MIVPPTRLCLLLAIERFLLLLHASGTVCRYTSLQHHLDRLSEEEAEAVFCSVAVSRPFSESSHFTAPYKLSFYLFIIIIIIISVPTAATLDLTFYSLTS